MQAQLKEVGIDVKLETLDSDGYVKRWLAGDFDSAIALNGVVDEIDEERWTAVIDTNLTGFWRTMKACVPLLRRRGGGAVVNLSSVQGLIGFQGWPAYAAAKGAIISLSIDPAQVIILRD